jgi:hypothetical protein
MSIHPRHPLYLRRARPAVALLAATTAIGCYDYVAPPTGAIPPGADVRAALTDAGSAQMSNLLGPRTATVNGQVERANVDTLVLRVQSVTLMSGEANGWGGEQIAIPMSAIATVRERQLNRSRTALAAISGTGVVIALLLSQRLSSSAEGPINLPPPPPGQ